MNSAEALEFRFCGARLHYATSRRYECRLGPGGLDLDQCPLPRIVRGRGLEVRINPDYTAQTWS